MGGALGLALGGIAGAYGAYSRNKAAADQQKKQQDDAMLLDAVKQNPAIGTTDAFQQHFKKNHSPEVAQTYMALGQMKKASDQSFQQQYGSSPAPVGGASPTAGGGNFAPDAQGNLVQAKNAPQPSGDPMQAHMDQLNSDLKRYREGLLNPAYQNDPAKLKFLETAQSETQKQIDQLQSQQFRGDEAEKARQQREDFHADTVAHQKEMEALSASNAETSNTLKTLMAKIDAAKFDEDKQKNFDTSRKALAGQLQNINKLLTSANPPDTKTLQPLLDKYNAMARQLKNRADENKIDYDEDEFKPVTASTVETHPWISSASAGLLGGTKTELASGDAASAAPPPDASSELLDGSGKVVGHRLKDGTIKWLAGSPSAATAGK